MKQERSHRALYVAIEGIDGAGKSTVIRRVASRLRRAGYRVVTRREPVSLALGQYAQRASVADPWTGAIFFTLDRYIARSALEEDLRSASVVLTDRSFWSTLAYQGTALSPARRRTLEDLQREATVAPDAVLLIDIDPTHALSRIGARRATRGPLERQRTLERVARAYRRFAREHHWVILDGQASLSEVIDQATRAIQTPLTARSRSRGRGRS